ncbi:hypothetical protein BHL85_08740 [Limosilactobacillus reuteri]|nr:hypothetical protein BHL85_08740 [Limosilactobacillus reuteri]
MEILPNFTQCDITLNYLNFTGKDNTNMAIKCTVTTDLQAKDTNGYSGMQKHVEHDKNINHSNGRLQEIT